MNQIQTHPLHFLLGTRRVPCLTLHGQANRFFAAVALMTQEELNLVGEESTVWGVAAEIQTLEQIPGSQSQYLVTLKAVPR